MGDFLSVPNKSKESFDGQNDILKFGSSAMQGWRYRMEDAHLHQLNNNFYDIFGVFDGHGGKEVSVFVKNHFIEEFMNSQSTKCENIPNALVETFLKMDELLKSKKGKEELKLLNKQSKEEDDLQDKKSKNKNLEKDFYKYLDPKNSKNCDISSITGCTSCVIIIDQKFKKIFFANAGDSRAVICKKGVAYQMSHDHKPDSAKEKNRIYKSGGWVSEGRIKGNLNLSRSLGDFEYKQNKKLSAQYQMITAYPEINIELLDENCEFIILACDGIWDCLTPQEACDFVRNKLYEKNGKVKPNVKLSKIVEQMMDSIIAEDINSENGIGCDNMTCILIQFKH